ncbi:MAG: hypothetical protein ACFFDB_00575 [Promethearchaeota archaeon]
MGIEDCPYCQKNINSDPGYFQEIKLSDLKKQNYFSFKIYSYLQYPLEQTRLKMSNIVNSNFTPEEIFKSLFGKYRNKNTGVLGNSPVNTSILIDYFLFMAMEMDNRYDFNDYTIPMLKKFLKKRRRTRIIEDIERNIGSFAFGDEYCPKCHKRIIRKEVIDYKEEILLSDLSYDCTVKIYQYLKLPLEDMVFRFTSILLDNFKTKEIYISLFGKYRKNQEFKFTKGLLIDFFIFLINSQDNERERQEFLIPSMRRFLRMREKTKILVDE